MKTSQHNSDPDSVTGPMMLEFYPTKEGYTSLTKTTYNFQTLVAWNGPIHQEVCQQMNTLPTEQDQYPPHNTTPKPDNL